jgi:hypothetical protein
MFAKINNLIVENNNKNNNKSNDFVIERNNIDIGSYNKIIDNIISSKLQFDFYNDKYYTEVVNGFKLEIEIEKITGKYKINSNKNLFANRIGNNYNFFIQSSRKIDPFTFTLKKDYNINYKRFVSCHKSNDIEIYLYINTDENKNVIRSMKIKFGHNVNMNNLKNIISLLE